MDVSNPEIAQEMELESICDSVTGRSVYTYLPRRTKLNGQVLKNASEQYGDNGDGLESNPSTWSNKCKDARSFLFYTDDAKRGQRAVIVSKWDELDPNKKEQVIFAIGGMQREAVTKNMRGDVTYNIFAEMPREKADRLIEMIKEKPILLERFYQNTFKDLDSEPDKDTGLRRIKTDNLWIIDLKDERPQENAVKLKLPEKIGVRD